MPRCPGQDQRYWTAEDIFDVKCPSCGNDIEFWKDEPMRLCPSCEKEVRNPRIDLGCAKWCKYAKECLGKMPGEIPAIPLIESLKVKLEAIDNVTKEDIEKAENISCIAEQKAINEGGEVVVTKSVALLAYIVKTKQIELPEDFLKSLDLDSSLDARINNTLEEVISETSSENLETKIILESL